MPAAYRPACRCWCAPATARTSRTPSGRRISRASATTRRPAPMAATRSSNWRQPCTTTSRRRRRRRPTETNDGSHIVYAGNGRDGGDLHYLNGTTATFTMVNNRLLPTSISDHNGNYVQIAYEPECVQVGTDSFCDVFAPMAIDYISDTLGRVIQFNYDSSYRLTSISAPGLGGTAQNPVTQTVVQFDYQTVTANGTFSGLTVERGTAGSITSLKHVYFPATGTGYMPSYSIYGQITGVSGRRQMSIGCPNTIPDGVESNNVSFNYPTAGPLTDAPAFSQRTETAVNAPTSTYTYGRWDGSRFSVFII